MKIQLLLVLAALALVHGARQKAMDLNKQQSLEVEKLTLAAKAAKQAAEDATAFADQAESLLEKLNNGKGLGKTKLAKVTADADSLLTGANNAAWDAHSLVTDFLSTSSSTAKVEVEKVEVEKVEVEAEADKPRHKKRLQDKPVNATAGPANQFQKEGVPKKQGPSFPKHIPAPIYRTDPSIKRNDEETVLVETDSVTKTATEDVPMVTLEQMKSYVQEQMHKQKPRTNTLPQRHRNTQHRQRGNQWKSMRNINMLQRNQRTHPKINQAQGFQKIANMHRQRHPNNRNNQRNNRGWMSTEDTKEAVDGVMPLNAMNPAMIQVVEAQDKRHEEMNPKGTDSYAVVPQADATTLLQMQADKQKAVEAAHMEEAINRQQAQHEALLSIGQAAEKQQAKNQAAHRALAHQYLDETAEKLSNDQIDQFKDMSVQLQTQSLIQEAQHMGLNDELSDLVYNYGDAEMVYSKEELEMMKAKGINPEDYYYYYQYYSSGYAY